MAQLPSRERLIRSWGSVSFNRVEISHLTRVILQDGSAKWTEMCSQTNFDVVQLVLIIAPHGIIYVVKFPLDSEGFVSVIGQDNLTLSIWNQGL